VECLRKVNSKSYRIALKTLRTHLLSFAFAFIHFLRILAFTHYCAADLIAAAGRSAAPTRLCPAVDGG
jgi:hypothetical protein